MRTTDQTDRNGVELHPWKAIPHTGYLLWGSATLWAGILMMLSQTVAHADLFIGAFWAGSYLAGLGVLLIVAPLVGWALAMAEAFT
jgi:hypothetical protein